MKRDILVTDKSLDKGQITIAKRRHFEHKARFVEARNQGVTLVIWLLYQLD